MPAIDDVPPRFEVHEVHSIALRLPPSEALELARARARQVRVVTHFRAEGELPTTETRFAAVDKHARRAFRRLVGPFSGLIRRRLLAQIAKRAG